MEDRPISQPRVWQQRHQPPQPRGQTGRGAHRSAPYPLDGSIRTPSKSEPLIEEVQDDAMPSDGEELPYGGTRVEPPQDLPNTRYFDTTLGDDEDMAHNYTLDKARQDLRELYNIKKTLIDSAADKTSPRFVATCTEIEVTKRRITLLKPAKVRVQVYQQLVETFAKQIANLRIRNNLYNHEIGVLEAEHTVVSTRLKAARDELDAPVGDQGMTKSDLHTFLPLLLRLPSAQDIR